jgi:hypothetical protein
MSHMTIVDRTTCHMCTTVQYWYRHNETRTLRTQMTNMHRAMPAHATSTPHTRGAQRHRAATMCGPLCLSLSLTIVTHGSITIVALRRRPSLVLVLLLMNREHRVGRPLRLWSSAVRWQL